MVRKLSLAIAVALGVAPIGVTALGLGDIKLHSALNQNFNADIELLSVEQGEISDVQVELAPVNAFKQAREQYKHMIMQGFDDLERFFPQPVKDEKVKESRKEPAKKVEVKAAASAKKVETAKIKTVEKEAAKPE